MSLGQKLICLSGITTDLAFQYMKPTQSRFIKNLYYQLTDSGDAGDAQGSQKGVMKPLQANYLYSPIELPSGTNHLIGTCSSIQTTEV